MPNRSTNTTGRTAQQPTLIVRSRAVRLRSRKCSFQPRHRLRINAQQSKGFNRCKKLRPRWKNLGLQHRQSERDRKRSTSRSQRSQPVGEPQWTAGLIQRHKYRSNLVPAENIESISPTKGPVMPQESPVLRSAGRLGVDDRVGIATTRSKPHAFRRRPMRLGTCGKNTSAIPFGADPRSQSYKSRLWPELPLTRKMHPGVVAAIRNPGFGRIQQIPPGAARESH